MKIDFKKTINLYSFLFAFATLGWYKTYHTKQILKDIHPFTLVMLTNIISFIILCAVLQFENYYSLDILKKDVMKTTTNDFVILILISLIYLFGHLVSSTFLQYHDVHTMKISKYMITIFVGALAFYIFNVQSISFDKGVGFALMCLGGILFFDISNV